MPLQEFVVLFQNKEEPPAHFEKIMILFAFGSSKGDNSFENILK